MSEKYTLEVKQVDECFIEIPPELLQKVGWKEEDNIKFNIRENGSISLRKVKTERVELEFEDEELLKMMMMAHDKGISFDDFCELALKEMINKHEFESECG
jgi:antitoxin component of MazEF toxin-antitoxin module